MQRLKREISKPYQYLHPNTTTMTMAMAMEEPTSEFDLPGFRFHPTEEELLDFYLRNMALGKYMRFEIIGFLNIYRHDPWDLPGLAKIGEREWYFFVPRDKRHGSGGRPNRTTENGFWKATGSDRKIFSSKKRQLIGLRKTLVFYKGRAPRGNKTDWVMNEYRLLQLDTCPLPKEIVLCKIYRKATSLKVLEQRAAMEEEITKTLIHHQQLHTPITPPMDATSFSSQNYVDILPDPPITTSHVASITKKEDEYQDLLVTVGEKMKDEDLESEGSVNSNKNGASLRLPDGMEKLGGLQIQLPNMDWTQDSFWTQLCSPWLDYLTLTPYANILNF